MKKILITTAVAIFTLPAFADDHKAFTYEQFETSIPHFDLENCPESMNVEKAFCRVVMHDDAMHVYAFSEDASAAMVGFKSFDEDEFQIVLK